MNTVVSNTARIYFEPVILFHILQSDYCFFIFQKNFDNVIVASQNLNRYTPHVTIVWTTEIE